MKAELKPCPFCGGVGVLAGRKAFEVRCTSCFASTDSFSYCNSLFGKNNPFILQSDAVAAWNRRTNDKELKK